MGQREETIAPVERILRAELHSCVSVLWDWNWVMPQLVKVKTTSWHSIVHYITSIICAKTLMSAVVSALVIKSALTLKDLLSAVVVLVSSYKTHSHVLVC